MPTLGELAGEVARLRRRAERRKREAAAGVRQPFGLGWMRTYLPHYLTCEPSQLHRDLAADLSGFHLTRGRRENRLAPRSSGKTVWATTGYGIYCGVEGVEPYTLVFSETSTQANAFLRDIRTEIEENPDLARDYPDAAGKGIISRDDVIKLRNGCMIQARGVGGSVRGLKNRESRPSLIIGDDLNEDEDAYSATRRARKLDWFKKSVMNLGSPQTNMIVLGTAIHRGAVVYELYRGEMAAGWHSRAYRSVLRWPERMDLWHEWERVLSNQADPDRVAKARAFYDANRAEMDRGAEVLWPDREPLYTLMSHRVAVGASAFDSEKQDKPGTEGSTEWPSDYFDRGDLWFDQWPDDLIGRAFYLDPSKGEGSKPGDWQAHCWGGWSRKGNALYVECDLRREPTTDMVARAIRVAQGFGCPVTAETNGTMGLLIAEFERQADGRMVGLQGITNTDAKLQRIRTLGPFLARGQVKVRQTAGGRELVSQLRDVPGGEWDDAPDAASGVLRRVMVNLNGG